MMKNNAATPLTIEELPKLHIVKDKDIGNVTPDVIIDKTLRKKKKRLTLYQKLQKRTYHQMVPKSIIKRYEEIEAKIEPNIGGYEKDYLFQVISIVTWHLRRDGGLAKLKIEYIKLAVPQGDVYLMELLNNHILIRKGQYLPGVKSYKYCFHPDHQDKYVPVGLHNQKLIDRTDKLRELKNKKRSASLIGHTRQKKNLERLTIDPVFYEKFNNRCPKKYIKKKNRYIASATRITNRDYNCSRDNTSQRLHSNITNMPSYLRKYLRLDGKKLKNIDIKNSQPYLSILLLTNPRKVAVLAKDPAFAAQLKTMKAVESADVTKYIKLVTEGRLYEYLMSEFKKKGLRLSRNKTKRQLLRIFFARNEIPKKHKDQVARLIFIDLFPVVHNRFCTIRGYGEGDNSSQNFKRFAILMQRIESYLVLDVIMKKVYLDFPGRFVMTIHDSILTEDDEIVVESIKKRMKKEIEKFVGFEVRLKVE